MTPKLWTIQGLATEFQKDRRTIAKRLEEVEPDQNGKWLMRKAAPAILGITALDPTQQKASLDEARTRKLDLEIAKMEGTLLDSNAVQLAVANMIGRARSRLLAIPGAEAGRANPEDPKRAESAIRDAIYEALNELAEMPVGAVEGTAESDDHGVGGRVPDSESGVERSTWEVEN